MEDFIEVIFDAVKKGKLILHCENCKKEINKHSEDWIIATDCEFLPCYISCNDYF